jgi:hypothetical protein
VAVGRTIQALYLVLDLLDAELAAVASAEVGLAALLGFEVIGLHVLAKAF